jgi:hypothetical protein
MVNECETAFNGIIDDARTGYNPNTAGERLAELQAMAAECDPAIGPWAFSQEGLFSVLEGTVAAGGDCTPTDVVDNPDYAALLSCADDTTCRLSISLAGLKGKCGAPSGVGGSCWTELECAADLYCDGTDITGGDCVARQPNSSACGNDTQCQSLTCTNDVCADPTVNGSYCLNPA